jgi:hypothetical protein
MIHPQTVINMRKTVSFLMLVILTVPVLYGQGKKAGTQGPALMTGYQYLLSRNDYTAFKYSRTYSTAADNFITVYKIYHPVSGAHFITITATHHKSSKTVEVVVEEAGGGILGEINKEHINYETPTMSIFGFRGDVGLLGGNKVPNQISVKFASPKFENIKVVNIAGSHENNEFEFFVLDVKS